MQIQRLKNKMGNVANASCETELRGHAQMVGAEGRGVATILKMVTMTRFDCMVGSSSGMRQAVAQALHHCAYRFAFGKRLAEQPLMQNVLADLVIEHEAALALTMRIGPCARCRHASEHEKMLVRVGTAVGKYWICKRTPAHAYEAMECIGGSGVMEDCIMPRCSASHRSTRSGRAAATCSAWTCCAPCSRNPGSVDAYMDEVQCRGRCGPAARRLCGQPGPRVARRRAHRVPCPPCRGKDGTGPAGLAAGALRESCRGRCLLRSAPGGAHQWTDLWYAAAWRGLPDHHPEGGPRAVIARGKPAGARYNPAVH
jgi:hypothetical protein